MKIISWNVNGIRAVQRKGNLDDVFKGSPDIVCLQETKAEETQLVPEIAQRKGYHSYFASSHVKKGYSGVAVYTKQEPEKIAFGLGIEKLDQEGRLLVLYFKDFVLLNCYFPNGGGGPERLKYKLEFYDAFLNFIETLKGEGHSIVFCGDVNTAHEAIDLARPKENETNTGFLPEERAWLDEVITAGYVDAFRHLYPNKTDIYTYWDMKTRARDRNVGWRIDYFFISSDLAPKIKQVKTLTHVFGSDHCPLVLELI